MHTYYVYVMASRSRRLYVGMTRDLMRRVWQHKVAMNEGHTSRYRITRLVYFEVFADVQAARVRERQLKAWPRERKLRLIEGSNLGWLDLSVDWYSGEWSPDGERSRRR